MDRKLCSFGELSGDARIGAWLRAGEGSGRNQLQITPITPTREIGHTPVTVRAGQAEPDRTTETEETQK